MLDLIIIILVILGAFIGCKRGFTTELVSIGGFIISLILAFILKNPISAFLYDKLPFFSFGGVLKGVTALNILLYEIIAFLISLFILTIILKLLKIFTKIFESFLNATIILGIPSKILGGVLGALEWLIISFIILFVLSLPIFNNKFVFESKIYDGMLKVSNKFNKELDNTYKVFKEFDELKDEYTSKDADTNQFNLDTLDLFLKYNIIDIDSAEKLYQKGKFKKIDNIESVLSKYKK